METRTGLGVFLLVTALVILVPVVWQIREGRFTARQVWGIFVLVAGLASVGAGYAFFTDDAQRALTIGGLGAVVFGLLVHHRRPENQVK
ncbi:MAG TPA: hypothetical protein VK928_02765 [Longimicrobiales bacterium]|nr:hypothetical protein [Longimicrobiales bacterium]